MRRRHHWLGFVLPFAVYGLSGWLFATLPAPSDAGSPSAAVRPESDPDESEVNRETPAPPRLLSYPVAYSLQIALTSVAMLLVWPVYRIGPIRIGAWSVGVGLLGGLVWITVCQWGLESRLWHWLGKSQWAGSFARPAFDPFETFGPDTGALVAFLAVRLFGLVLLVPIIEEFFVRGFLMRFFIKPDWWTIPLGNVSLASAVIPTVYGVLTHPAEALAALFWFSLITLLYARTRSLWDCVVAHAVTNGMLGVYVLVWEDWTLW